LGESGFVIRVKAVLNGNMNNASEIKRLSDAVASIASTIAEIIDTKLKASIENPNASEVASGRGAQLPAALEGWVGKKEVAEHLNVSLRTLDVWMKKGYLPYIRIGRSVRFKLSDSDEALTRRHKRHGSW
jgi:excisionase family DNA binding protein